MKYRYKFPLAIEFSEAHTKAFHRIRKNLILDRDFFLDCQKLCQERKDFQNARFFSDNSKHLLTCLKALDYIGKYHLGLKTNVEVDPFLAQYVNEMLYTIDTEATLHHD